MELDSQMKLGFTTLIFSSIFLAWVYRLPLNQTGSLFDNGGCGQLLESGWLWRPEHVWQPYGCFMAAYSKNMLHECFSGKSIYVVGDSVARSLYVSLTSRIDPRIRNSGHENFKLQYPPGDENTNITTLISFYWDPYLDQSDVGNIIGETKKPAILLISSGFWHMKNFGHHEGLVKWTVQLDRLLDRIKKLTAQSVLPKIFFAPLSAVVPEKLSTDRQNITKLAVEDFSHRLSAKIKSFIAANPVLKDIIHLPDAWAKIYASSNLLSLDGLHYDQSVYDAVVNTMLNYACNQEYLSKSPLMKSTCCNSYANPSWKQLVFMSAILFFGPVIWLLRSVEILCGKRILPSTILPNQSNAKNITIFGLCIILMFFSDRTNLFMKQQKHFDSAAFTVLILGSLAVGLTTISTDKDSSFLNRKQTDEWKGWMQIVILIYHYTGASSISGIYNVVRILVAAYLFMTGFGNFTYFYRKEDFSILRVVKVLFRLNLLAVALPYALDSTFQSYYFSPLVTLWFFLIYSTMHIYSEKNNKSDMVIYGKFIVLTIFVSILVANPSVFEFAVNTVARLTGSKWNAKEWLFRVALDRYIVICGMLFAFFLIKSKESSSFVRDYHWIAAPIATVAMLGYLWFCLSTDKFSYNKYHPFLSWIPVVAFIFLRNINEAFRKTTSSFFVYIGQISLETFIVQFHLWLALDTKGLLVVLPEHWWLNLLLTTIIFIYVSRLLSESTNAISEWLLEDSADFKFHTLIAVIAMIIFNYLPA